MPDLNALHAFNRVMETGSLTQSAAELGLAKSTLSRRISQLEAGLGQPLLKRQANQLLPTEAGRRYYAISRQILDLAQRGQRDLDSLREEVSGDIVVEAHRTLTRAWLGRAMEDFLEQHPGIRITLRTGEKPAQDPEFPGVCVWLGKIPESGLRHEEIGSLKLGIYAHPDYLAQHGAPREPADLARHSWVDLMGATHGGINLYHVDGRQEHFQPPSSRFRVDQPALHIDAIARGRGLGLLPCWQVAARNVAHPGQLERCLADWSPNALPVTLIYGFGHHPRKISALLSHLRQARPAAWAASANHRTPKKNAAQQESA
ncbi:LysR family transcriptional regulator [Halomonas binhaiensis]|uniref:LysR family transcriptional regulator n=1 Tax=Halomonas binhaiensis TaxID=2562282 RepID=A0A5C1NK62_9GAMM|nr:LysR family transcriptional regulator [Halomonas binhaiensis]QEM82747.1 LysR family transcriptional regulator [Halomonas binhaiensis]